ncbi:Protein of unknown function (DUF1657) [Desulfosporosinus orientis DSM 765]|uniref:Uncharacterized protein n=1 Tax=Desulfosporosinus orientis (strain ATCC 19365 / DSM 765 / NCIMB 8382 / VKM B-1628 / Singapore I) TaxID=768706 RepID=G7WA36_DESOD|nr:DUF1657 domain-containing protein [Desulfosporosinus orientis]AET66174.1 Protein of unknown function (DUF1657) [Desulfosporosinus orientis DSM 765]
MTIQADLEKAVASAQSALGTYETFAASTQDDTAKAMYKDLSGDMERHVAVLKGRLNYVTENNPMNKPIS